ncbi:hypothetical protein F7725_024410, partial [Dissostichus mawsoni]
MARGFLPGGGLQQSHIFSQSHSYEEGVGLQSQPVVVVQFDGPGGVHGDVALVGDQRREEEELHLGQLLSDAPPLPQREDEHAAGQVLVQDPILQEALGFKGLRVGPQLRVVVDGPLVDEDHGVLWYGVAHDGGVRGGGVGDGERHEAGEAHHLVDEGHDVGQLGLVLEEGQPAAVHHLVHFLPQTHLHLRSFPPDKTLDFSLICSIATIKASVMSLMVLDWMVFRCSITLSPMNLLNSRLSSLKLSNMVLMGLGKVLQPGHHVHDAAGPHGLGELVVPAHHLLELLVIVRVPLPEAHRAHDVGRAHHQVVQGLEVLQLLCLLHKQLQQHFELAQDVVLKSPFGVRVPRGEHAHGGLSHPAVDLPPVRDGVEPQAVPVGDVLEGGEVRSSSKVESLLHQRLPDRVPIQHHHRARAQFDLEHVAVFLRHARKVQVRGFAELRSVPDDRPGERAGGARGRAQMEPAPQVEGEQQGNTPHQQGSCIRR